MDPVTRREELRDSSKTTALRCQRLLLRPLMFVDTFHAIVSSVQYSTHTCSDRARQYSYARPSFRSEEPSRTEQRVLQHSPTAVLELYPFYRELGVEITYSSLLWIQLSYRLSMLLCLSESGRDECLTYRPCCSLHCLLLPFSQSSAVLVNATHGSLSISFVPV